MQPEAAGAALVQNSVSWGRLRCRSGRQKTTSRRRSSADATVQSPPSLRLRRACTGVPGLPLANGRATAGFGLAANGRRCRVGCRVAIAVQHLHLETPAAPLSPSARLSLTAALPELVSRKTTRAEALFASVVVDLDAFGRHGGLLD